MLVVAWFVVGLPRIGVINGQVVIFGAHPHSHWHCEQPRTTSSNVGLASDYEVNERERKSERMRNKLSVEKRVLSSEVMRNQRDKTTPPPSLLIVESHSPFLPSFLPSLCMNNNSGRTRTTRTFCYTKSASSSLFDARNHLVACRRACTMQACLITITVRLLSETMCKSRC